MNSAVFILVFTETYGKKLKMYKYYWCATLFIYESIWVLSMFTILYSLMDIWRTGSGIDVFQNVSFGRFLASLVIFLHLTIAILHISWHWLKNTCNHIALCRSNTFGVSKNLIKNNYISEKVPHRIECWFSY